MHLSIWNGNITINSGNDGINTNEDEVSVTTINGGVLNIRVSGETGEGDGIDSNGWLVINGGTVIAQACGFSPDAGIDSDMGIHINGGTVIASGNMLDHISESNQNYVVFRFASNQKGGSVYTMKNVKGDVVFEYTPENNFGYLIISSEKLKAGTYTLWTGEVQLAASTGAVMGGFGGGMMGGMPGGFRDGMPGGFPGGMQMWEGIEPPNGMDGKRPEDGRGGPGGFAMGENTELSTDIVIVDGGNYFVNVSAAEK